MMRRIEAQVLMRFKFAPLAWSLAAALGGCLTATGEVFSDGLSRTPQATTIGASGTAMGTKDGHSAAALSDGTVWCWGANRDGQLGDGTTNSSSSPVKVVGLPARAVSLAAGLHHTVALLENGTVWCWGRNTNGQLGNNSKTSSYRPVQVSNIATAMAIAAGDDHTVALLSDGSVWCWGSNKHGELGNGGGGDSNRPARVGSFTNAIRISARFHQTYVILSDNKVDGALWGWGDNAGGQIGVGTKGGNCPAPVQAFQEKLNHVIAVAAGDHHTCAVLSSGEVWGWGANFFGQLGNNDSKTAQVITAPVQTAGIKTATAVSAGDLHTCAILQDGSLWCWGFNSSGQVGGKSGPKSIAPTKVVLSKSAKMVVGGGLHTITLLEDGTVQCWGENGAGQLGNGTKVNSSTPVTAGGSWVETTGR